MKKIFIASDHAGYKLKKEIIRKFSKKLKFQDLGTNNSTKSSNYPYYAHKLCNNVKKNKLNIGILVCGSGMGMSIAANKHKNVRAALCYNQKSAQLSRSHNNANVITLGSRLTKKSVALECINTILKTKFESGRHTKRIKKI